MKEGQGEGKKEGEGEGRRESRPVGTGRGVGKVFQD